MAREKLAKERLAMVGLAALLVSAGTYAVVKSQRRPAPIVFNGIVRTSDPTAAESAPPPAAVVVVVHATGAVNKPGVLRMPSDSRVEDAIKAAGGAAPDADLTNINLAAKLVDGSQVYVPHLMKPGEVNHVADPYRGGSAQKGDGAGGHHSGHKVPPTSPVNLNTATEAELESVPGIGPATAAKIIDYRTSHKKFSSVDELSAISGMGEKKLASLKKYLRL